MHYGLGMDSLVTQCSSNTNAMVERTCALGPVRFVWFLASEEPGANCIQLVRPLYYCVRKSALEGNIRKIQHMLISFCFAKTTVWVSQSPGRQATYQVLKGLLASVYQESHWPSS